MYLFLYYTYLVHYNLRNYALYLNSFVYARYEEDAILATAVVLSMHGIAPTVNMAKKHDERRS
jgi:hypothetical protein